MDGWDLYYECVDRELGRQMERHLHLFRESLEWWLYAELNWPSRDWEVQLQYLVDHTRYYGLEIHPVSIQSLHDLVEARINGTGPFEVLGPYRWDEPAVATGEPIQVALTVGLDDGTRTNATVAIEPNAPPIMKESIEAAKSRPSASGGVAYASVQQGFSTPVVPAQTGVYVLGSNEPANEHPLKSTWGHDKQQISNPVDAQIYSRIAIEYFQRAWLTLTSGRLLGYPHAAKIFKHFLGNTGATYEIDFRALNHADRRAYDNMVRELNDALDAAEAFAATHPPGAKFQMVTIRETRQPAIHDGSDWEYAISGYRTWAHGV